MRTSLHAISAMSLLLGGLAATTLGQQPDYYPLNVGERWEYKVQVADKTMEVANEITKIETINNDSLARVETVSNGKTLATEHLKTSEKGIFRYRIQGLEVNPPLCLLRYPVKEGDAWETQITTGGENAKVTCRVLGQRKIKVSAGEFDTVLVEIHAEASSGNVTSTYWFAEGVGVIQQITELPNLKISMTLEKHTSGRKSP